MIRKTLLTSCIALILSANANAASVDEEILALKTRIDQLESGKISSETMVEEEKENSIEFGGAARFQYSYEDYADSNKDRGGDLDFDLFRIDVDGNIGDILFSAQYRWFQYMNVIHHAWVGYDFDESQQGKIGVTQVPFGILTWASNSYFFSSNFYLGLEDDYDLGLNYTYKTDDNRLDLAFYKNDELGGLDGYVSDRSDRYAYDVVGVRLTGEGTYDAPTLEAAESNTFNARYVHNLTFSDVAVELGASVQSGQLDIAGAQDGDRFAAAMHGVVNYNRWNLKLQVTGYEYDVDGMDVEQMVVGAYHFYDSIPAEATTYIGNLAYSLPVSIGPISNLTFYNDYSLVTDKSADLEDTFMNVTGMAITAGGLYTYVDFVVAENQPFIGGSMVGNGEVNKRVNINFGYYF
ncbi:carbohydrate porin [Shewanella sp. D64]|uniref:carbohydrate porin n=1 Tax=unclassified Shewanella TaxID=196818 RepID=UPI0022BA23C7|nr:MULTISPECIES: carbohydrate porin [unclassified Shewanella]MEC4725736.1 carbohydrate porin [Shewanella sp. D64]MEC4737657.1 carbohydrate porin [Shewanella sp. E94]WBJ98204.1 carbohydrate porin [Shewanella sp. MTB7]